MINNEVLTRESTDTILATQGFTLAICIDFNNLYFIFGMCIGIRKLFVNGSKVLTNPASVKEGS